MAAASIRPLGRLRSLHRAIDTGDCCFSLACPHWHKAGLVGLGWLEIGTVYFTVAVTSGIKIFARPVTVLGAAEPPPHCASLARRS